MVLRDLNALTVADGNEDRVVLLLRRLRHEREEPAPHLAAVVRVADDVVRDLDAGLLLELLLCDQVLLQHLLRPGLRVMGPHRDGRPEQRQRTQHADMDTVPIEVLVVEMTAPMQRLLVGGEGFDPARLDLASHLHGLGADHRAGAEASVHRLVGTNCSHEATGDGLITLPCQIEHDDFAALPDNYVGGIDVLRAPCVQGLLVLVVQQLRDLRELVGATFAGGGAARQRATSLARTHFRRVLF
mmetsp:Transcript_135004/g.349824  ORF Transcript_135004/g.349824 Transcript_135004/m.349824 type:complete len:243 (+) Transcript_135004:81-809(+)